MIAEMPFFRRTSCRTTRPIKKVATEQNESGSSDEENDDEDGFEILTAEKLFSTLLQRVSGRSKGTTNYFMNGV